MKRIMAVALSIAFAGSVIAAQAQDTATAPTTTVAKRKPAAKKSGPNISEQLSEMKAAIDAQQQQIKQLSDLVETREQKIQQLEQRLDQSQAVTTQAQTKADTAAAQTAEEQQTMMALKSDVTDLQTGATSSALNLQETQKRIGGLEIPLALHFKGITITPGGFLAAETVYRNRALGADINTPFNGLNMPGSGQNAVSEFFASGRQSRISMLAEGKYGDTKLTGYMEGDFLSAGVTSNNNESNSYTLRQRQVWGQAERHGWSFTGGQMWSLVTETKKGVDNRTEAMPMGIDAQYAVGFSWARQPGFRVAKNFNNHFWLAASLENPQTTFAARNNASNFAFGGTGNGGGLYNATANYSFNAAPDFIVKAAFEPGFGHYEVFGIFSRFRDRVYPCAEPPTDLSLCSGGVISTQGAYNSSRNGGGVGANARVTLFKQLDFGIHGLMGNGVGRYGASVLPDATVNPDGTLALLRSYQGLGTLEWHLPRFDVYLNGGGEYVGRHWQIDPNNSKTPAVGYGSPLFDTADCYSETLPGSTGFSFGGLSKCQADTRVVLEGTLGFWYRLYNGPKGKLQFGSQYAYVTRNTWAGTGGAPHGIENMIFTSFRYYLP
jgi:hypothetical protein